jgi:hypothetical protein
MSLLSARDLTTAVARISLAARLIRKAKALAGSRPTVIRTFVHLSHISLIMPPHRWQEELKAWLRLLFYFHSLFCGEEIRELRDYQELELWAAMCGVLRGRDPRVCG